MTTDEQLDDQMAVAYAQEIRARCLVCGNSVAVDASALAAAKAEAWDERDKARPKYLGPQSGHYEDCMGWEDCCCASYPNPYRAALGGPR